MSSLTNWLGAIALALLLGTAYHLDGPSEIETAMDSAQSAADAAYEAQTRERVARIAQRACGENAYWQLLEGNVVQCFTKRGIRTAKLAL